jgi:nicotinamide-nucleotide adenylyltransferase
MATALFVTRAQPFHLGHVKVIRDILKRNRKVIIAIGSSQMKNTEKNPFSAREREEMINQALRSARIKNYEIVRVPDLFNDQLWVARVNKVCKFDIVYSMNPWTIRCFKRAGIKVRKHSLYRRKSCSGSRIRKTIARNGKWESLVPRPVAEYIREIKGAARVKRLERGRK